MEYARNRGAFGQPISQFQVIKHKLVDMATKVNMVRAFVYECATRWDQGEYPVREISQAKLMATQIAVEVADDCIQIHGGLGVSKDLPLERWYRELRIRRIGEGPSEVQRIIIARDLLHSGLR